MARHTDRAKRPTAVAPDYSAVPAALRPLKHWVMWRFDWNDKRSEWAKVPYQPSGVRASSTGAETWSSFESCVATFEQQKSKFDGIGFVFSEDAPFVGIDLDNCVISLNPDEVSLTAFASKIVAELQTYTEFSPSMTGLHLIGTAAQMKALKTAWNGNDIEVYRSGRYFTFTGRSWHDEPNPVIDVDVELNRIVSAIRQRADQAKQISKPNSPPAPENSSAPVLSVDRRIEMARRNEKTERLWLGDTSDYGGDQSRADFALCRNLAFFSDGSREILDQMFRRSALFRGKWDERHGSDTYGNATLEKILTTQTAFMGVRQNPSTAAAAAPKESTYETRKHRRLTVDDLWEQTLEYRKSGDARGVTTGWADLDQFYRPAKGLLTIVTGEPGSGKSTFLDALCFNIARAHNWRITFASFETLPIQRHILSLCQMYLQKPTFEFMENAATAEEMETARLGIRDYFNFVMPDDHENDIESLLAYVDDDIRDYNISGFVLDPFTELDQSRAGNFSQTEQIETILRRLQSFTRHRAIHSWLIAHPTKSGETYKNGRPTLRSISGSANFFNKADFGLVVHMTGTDENTVFIDKVRFDSNGGKGELKFRFDKQERTFYSLANESVFAAPSNSYYDANSD